MALPQQTTTASLAPAAAGERPPQHGGWYWNSNHLARAWLPLIGLEGLGLLDFYLATAEHRPGAPGRGWTAVTLDELARLTGWGRARLVRLNRLLAAAGLLEVRYEPVAGRGPAVQRARYRVARGAGLPDVAALARLAPLAERDPALAARLRRYTAGAPAAAEDGPAPSSRRALTAPESDESAPAAPDGPDAPAATPGQAGGSAPSPIPVLVAGPVPVPERNRSEDASKTGEDTTTSTAAPARDDEESALALWAAANGRPASCLERQRLAQLATMAAAGDDETGWDWVAAAIGEAVEAGSAYVAPRRVARILERWLAEGRSGRSSKHAPESRRDRAGRQGGRSARGGHERPARRSHSAHSPVGATSVASAAPAAGAAPASLPERAADQAPVAVVAAGEEGAAAGPAWRPPAALPGLPAGPAAVLRAALAASGLEGEPYLRGATLACWQGEAHLLVATRAPVPAAVAARLVGRLGRGLSGLIGRPVGCELVAQAAFAARERVSSADGTPRDLS